MATISEKWAYFPSGGRNGYGAKLCNIFSTKFVVETQSNEEKKAFRQVTHRMQLGELAYIMFAIMIKYVCKSYINLSLYISKSIELS